MTVDGMSDPEYERMCYEYRYLFRGRQMDIGSAVQMPDWFAETPVGRTQTCEVAFGIPSLEQLSKLLPERIRLCQEVDEPAKNILLIFDSESGGWLLELQLADEYKFYGRGNSPHAAYLECIHEMSPYVVTEVDAEKRAEIFQMRRNQGKRPSLEDYTRRRAEREKARQQAKKRKFFIYCDKDGVLQFTVDGDPAKANHFEPDSLEIARSLVRKRTSTIEPDTVYGPFEHETWWIHKDALDGMY